MTAIVYVFAGIGVLAVLNFLANVGGSSVPALSKPDKWPAPPFDKAGANASLARVIAIEAKLHSPMD